MIYVDPYGLWGEDIYNSVADTYSSESFNSRFQGACQMFGGVAEMTAGGVIGLGSCGMAAPIGAAVVVHGADHLCTGFNKVFSGTHDDTVTSKLLQTMGMSPQTANSIDNTAVMVATIGGTVVGRSAQLATNPQFKLPPVSTSVAEGKLPLSSGAESVNAGINLNKKLSLLESFPQDAAKIRTLSDSRIRYYAHETLSRTPGPTRGAGNVVEWNPKTSNVRAWYECRDHLGSVNRVHPKNINGQTVLSPHYPPTAKDLIK